MTLRRIDTPVGAARAWLTAPRRPRVLAVLGHGAGGGVDAPDLAALGAALPAAGVAVALVEQPYRVAGRRAPDRAERLDAAWTAVVSALVGSSMLRDVSVVCGGRSAGARVACRTAAATGAAGIVALAFPLHPPGRPERSRAAELTVDAPLLVVQGERDAFGRPAEFPPGIAVHAIPAADHSLRSAVPDVVAVVVEWLSALAATVNPPRRAGARG